MPLFNLACEGCGKKSRILAASWGSVSQERLRCDACPGVLRRAATGVSSQAVERLDNGLMPKAVERLADAERLFQERAKNSDPLAGGVQHLNRPGTPEN